MIDPLPADSTLRLPLRFLLDARQRHDQDSEREWLQCSPRGVPRRLGSGVRGGAPGCHLPTPQLTRGSIHLHDPRGIRLPCLDLHPEEVRSPRSFLF